MLALETHSVGSSSSVIGEEPQHINLKTKKENPMKKITLLASFVAIVFTLVGPSRVMAADPTGSTSILTAPTISALSVTTLAQAGRLKISGSSFGAEQGSGIVTIDGATAPVSNWTDASITAYVPDSSPLGSEPVQVVTSGGRSTLCS